MGMPRSRRSVHHPQHRGTARRQESPNEQSGECEEDNIEPGRVIPGNWRFNHARVPLCWDETKSPKYQLNNQRGAVIAA
jgi:hypothetical protein